MNEWRNEMDERFHLPRQHNGRVGWAEWSWICWWVKGAAAPRQPANKRDKPAQSARLLFPFSSMKSIELWNWFHWIAELEWDWFVSELMKRNGKPRKWNGMNLWMKFLFAGVNEVESMNGRAVRRRTTQPKPTILCGWAWKASKELVWLLRPHSFLFNQSNGMKIDWLCCPLIQLRWYAAVAGYGLLAQQQLILHSSLIDWLVCLFFN